MSDALGSYFAAFTVLFTTEARSARWILYLSGNATFLPLECCANTHLLSGATGRAQEDVRAYSNAFGFGLPDEFVYLQAEAHVQAVFEDPFGELLRIEEAMGSVASAAGVFAEGGREDDAVHAGGQVVFAGEVAGEFVIGTVREDEFHFVAPGERFEVGKIEAVGCA